MTIIFIFLNHVDFIYILNFNNQIPQLILAIRWCIDHIYALMICKARVGSPN